MRGDEMRCESEAQGREKGYVREIEARGLRRGDGVGREGEEGKGREGGVAEICVERGSAKQLLLKGTKLQDKPSRENT